MHYSKIKTKKEAVDWYHDVFEERYISAQEYFQKQRQSVVNEYRNVLQQLAIVSGAIATFSLMLFDSPLSVFTGLLVIGVSLLLFNVVFIFLYLLWVGGKATETLREFETGTLIHLAAIRESFYKDVHRGDNLDSFIKNLSVSMEKAYTDEHFTYSVSKVDSSDLIVKISFSVGILFIVLSFLLPLLFCK